MEEPDLGTAGGAVCASTCSLQRAHPFRSLENLKGGTSHIQVYLTVLFSGQGSDDLPSELVRKTKQRTLSLNYASSLTLQTLAYWNFHICAGMLKTRENHELPWDSL